MNKVTGLIVSVIIIVIAAVAIAKHGSNNNTNSSNTNSGTSQTQSGDQSSQTKSTQGENDISIINMSFSPASLTVKQGASVKWTNNDNIAHTVNESDNQSGGPNSGTINPGASYSFTFNNAGVFHYHCSIHPDMLGTITVTQ